MNKHTIKLIDGKQSPYGPIYILSPVKLKTLKIYIEIYLKTGFIQLSKSPTYAPILSNKETNSSSRLCINSWSLDDLTIKNWYPFLLIDKALDQLDWAKQFI